jgi:hypothetical protein
MGASGRLLRDDVSETGVRIAPMNTPTADLLPANPVAAGASPGTGRGFTVVRIVLGLVLLTAAGLKLYGLNVTALPRVGWFAVTVHGSNRCISGTRRSV